LRECVQSITFAYTFVDVADTPGKSAVSRCTFDKCCAEKWVRG